MQNVAATGGAAAIPNSVLRQATTIREEVPSSFSTLAADRARLATEVQSLRAENADLKSHSFELSLLLDAALAKLEALGHTMVPTFTAADQIQRLRASREEAAQSKAWASVPPSEGNSALMPSRLGDAVVSATDGPSGGASTAVSGSTTSGSSNQKAPRYRSTQTIAAHRGAVFAAEFCPSSHQGGHLIASASFDGTVAISNSQTGAVEAKAGDHAAPVMDVTWTAGGKVVSCGLDGTAVIRDVEAARPRFTFRNEATTAGYVPGLVRLLTLSNWPHIFIVSDNAGGVSVVDDREGRGRVAFVQHTDPVTALADDGGSSSFGFLTGDAKGVVAIWDLRVAQQPQGSQRRYDIHRAGGSFGIAAIGATHCGVSHLSWSHDTYGASTVVAVTEDGFVRLFAEDSSRHAAAATVVTNPRDAVPSAADSPTAVGTLPHVFPVAPSMSSLTVDTISTPLATATRTFRMDARIAIPTQLCPVRAAFRSGTKVGINPRLVMDDDDADRVDARRVHLLGDEDLLACGGSDSIIRLFQRNTAQRKTRNKTTGQGDADETPPNGVRQLDAGRDDGSHDWAEQLSEESMVLYQQLEGHRDVVYGATFHRTEPVLASHSGDCTIRVWRPARLVS